MLREFGDRDAFSRHMLQLGYYPRVVRDRFVTEAGAPAPRMVHKLPQRDCTRAGRRYSGPAFRPAPRRRQPTRLEHPPMQVRVLVRLKPGVLDPQGRAVHHALEGLGFGGVEDVRIGRLIELDLADGTDEATIRQMCEKLLANTVIESFTIETPEGAR